MRAVDGYIVWCGIISSYQSAAVHLQDCKVFLVSACVRITIASDRLFSFLCVTYLETYACLFVALWEAQ